MTAILILVCVLLILAAVSRLLDDEGYITVSLIISALAFVLLAFLQAL